MQQRRFKKWNLGRLVAAAMLACPLAALLQPAHAQNEYGVWRQTIIVTTLDGTTMEYFIDKDTRVRIEQPHLVIETENVVLSYDLEQMKQVRYGRVYLTDGIRNATDSESRPFTEEDGMLFFRGLPENSQIGIYTTGGKAVASMRCGGDAQLPLGNLATGVYFVKINGETYKILKK